MKIGKKTISTMIISATILCLILSSLGFAATDAFKDIKYSWARDAINALKESGIMDGDDKGNFNPEDSVTRGEFAKILAEALALDTEEKGRSEAEEDTAETGSGFSDIDDEDVEKAVAALKELGIIEGYEDSLFRPERKITRAEAVAMLTRVVKLGENSDLFDREWSQSFTDVNPESWEFSYVEIGNRLGIVPIHFGLAFQPRKAATKAEIASMLKNTLDLRVLEGSLAETDSESRSLSLELPDGSVQKVLTDEESIILRNNASADLETLREGDLVHVVADKLGNTRFVTAFGNATKEDLINRLSALSDGTLEPRQIAALVRGDWETFRSSFEPELKERLVGQGLNEDEAEAILTTNWDTLGELAKTRACKAISDQTGLPADVIQAALDTDWDKVKEFAETSVSALILKELSKAEA